MDGMTHEAILSQSAMFEKADTKGKRGAFLLDKTDGGTGSKMPALEHDVDTRENGFMLFQAHKTVVPSKKKFRRLSVIPSKVFFVTAPYIAAVSRI